MGLIITKIKVIFFSLLLLLILSSSAYAFEDTVERYPNSVYTDFWTFSNGGAPDNYCQLQYNSQYKTNCLALKSQNYYSTNYLASITTKTTYAGVNYVSLTTRAVSGSTTGQIHFYFLDSNNNQLAHGYASNVKANTKYEAVWGTSDIKIYENGTLVQTTASTSGASAKIKIGVIPPDFSAPVVQIDDITTGSIIGMPKVITESTSDLYFTWAGQLMRSYTDPYKITLYSLTNPSNAGEVTSWNIGNSPEFGSITSSRSTILGTNFGLYMLEISRGTDVLYDQYFYYDQLSNPQGFPEILFLGTSSVNTEIRDEDQNGGEVEAGGSVYLYPDINSPADYTFSYDILSTPYAISTEFSTVYNTSSVNSIKLDYSGLSTMSYNVSVDGAQVGQTNGGDTYSHTFTGAGITNSHVISFAPDYSQTGVWGIVKDSSTLEGIPAVTVSVTGTNYGKTIYTDDNGLFYLPGLTAGNSYSVTVTKQGYTTPPSQTATTQAGVTTRQDFYMDKIATTSGAGLYYAPHDVAFTILEYWYSGAGITGVPYSISENGTEIKSGSTDSKGMFTGSNMSGGTNYTITLTHNGTTYTEYVEPALSEYTFVLNKEGILHEYCNSWLNLSYTENNGSIAIAYVSNKTLSAAAVTVTAANGTNIISDSKGDQSGSFNFNLSSGDYTIKFDIEAADGSKASQFWTLSSPPTVNLFPPSYPTWLKNLLYVGIIMIFLLAFGKSKNDVACGSAAVLVSLGYYFEWLSCGFNFVVLIWIIAIGAIYLHYKRTGALG